MESPEAKDMMTAVAIIAGAGTEGTVAGVLKGLVPTVAPDMIATGAGLLLFLFGDRVHTLLKAYGLGLMAGGLKGTIEKAIPPIGGAAAPAAPTGGTGSPAAAMAEAYAAQQSR